MKIAIIASGSQGDVQPYAALAKGLQQAGHTIKFVSHENYAGFIRKHGIEFWSVAGDVQSIAQSPEISAMLEQGKFIAIMKIMGEEARKASISMAEVALQACEDVDLILGGLGGLETGIAIGEKLGLPVLPAYLLPFTPTRVFPSVLAPFIPKPLGFLLNKASHLGTKQIMWQSLRKADQTAREKVLRLQPAPFFGPYQAKPVQGMPTIYGYSALVVPRPDDWPDNVTITGYWFLDSRNDWHPPAELVNFIESGPAPVFIGFGSMNHRDPEATTQLIIDAIIQSKQRAVLQTGWGGLYAADLPASIKLIDAVPHTWLFPKMVAVVHHAGVGTTASGLRAGVPNLVIPFFADQPFWGHRIEQLGVGPQPIPRKKLTSDKLAGAIKQAVTDPAMKLKAQILGEQLRSENGVKKAIEIIERSVGKRS